MKTPGYHQPLYLLPFDQRGAPVTSLFGWYGNLSRAQTAVIAAAKQIVYQGFKVALSIGVPREKAGILVDEQFGAALLQDAKSSGLVTACPAEQCGQSEFDFEYGDDFARHIELLQPTFCKVSVCYNPEGDFYLNRRQLLRLRRLSNYLQRESQSRFMFELQVPPEPPQLELFGGNKSAYNAKLRPQLVELSIHQLQNCGIEPDVWTFERFDRREDCRRIVAAVRRDGRHQVGCIVLGQGENDRKVRDWLRTAASVGGFIGFSVGRTDFWDPLVSFRANRIVREAAVKEIARRLKVFAAIFENTLPPQRQLYEGQQQVAFKQISV